MKGCVPNIRFSCFCGGNNTGPLDQGIGQGGFSVIDYDFGQLQRRLRQRISDEPWAMTDMLRIFAGLSINYRAAVSPFPDRQDLIVIPFKVVTYSADFFDGELSHR